MLKIDEPAQADLKEIWLYISENSIVSADRIIDELLHKFRLLEASPLLGRARYDLLVNLRSYPYKNYLIFYLPIENGVEIFRVLHAARNVEEVFTDFFEDLDE